MLEQRKGGGGVTDLRPDFFRSNFIFENIHWAVQKFRILIKFYVRMTDQEKNEYFHDFILWQQEGLDIEKQHCLFINFGVNMKFEHPQIRRVITIFIFSCKSP